MTTPQGGPYGNEHQPQSDLPYQRYNFPSTPSHRQQQGGRPPHAPQMPYGPPEPREPARQRPAQDSDGQGRDAGSGQPHPLVRPYAMTGGRTRPRYQLAIEALVHTTAEPARLQGQLPEHQRICRLCYEIKSVAEVSALLSIPLGVARILVADLAEAGLVAIHQPGGDESAGGQPDVTLLERVLSGLRKL
ncbi:DUF742 domain-containing protein [Streptomyces sp. TRM 70351]|uniref:DUF742 domain-containing protein n=1 Tax=Streptomyces sp. TRM 70351 TaxID=3116552 RepID=UPI002E7BB8E4|nr:DUF742 domain-containing protein [Streptomyces sp. TRM 70351]MEE1931572.1 DUF742 domain-containing protein [Streptomyces sp. TRM 70351]